jgi:dihydrofolate reductase
MVFSKKLKKAVDGDNWKNTTLFNEINPAEIRKFIRKKNKGAVILGSGSIVAQFANLGLIDEYTLVVAPVVLGAGKSMFKGVKKTGLKLLEAKPFKNGVVILKYGL